MMQKCGECDGFAMFERRKWFELWYCIHKRKVWIAFFGILPRVCPKWCPKRKEGEKRG